MTMVSDLVADKDISSQEDGGKVIFLAQVSETTQTKQGTAFSSLQSIGGLVSGSLKTDKRRDL